jgi:hypothetical protein
MGGEEEAGVVIQEGKGVDALALDFEVALEVSLPEVIGEGALEALVGGLRYDLPSQTAVAFENASDGAHAGQGWTVGAEDGVNFAWSPAVLRPNLEDALFKLVGSAAGAVVGFGGAVDERADGIGAIACEPLVPGLATNAVATASVGDGVVQGEDVMDKGES